MHYPVTLMHNRSDNDSIIIFDDTSVLLVEDEDGDGDGLVMVVVAAAAAVEDQVELRLVKLWFKT